MLKKLSVDVHGYSSADTIVGLVLFALTIVSLYQVMIPSFALWRNSDERIARQQDTRLAVDRIARDLHESTVKFGRIRAYNCGGPAANENCAAIGFVTARDSNCTGTFQLTPTGEPFWRGVIYIWLDVPSRELRRACAPDATMPALSLPPFIEYSVIGKELMLASFTLAPAGNSNPTTVAVALQEQAATASRPTYRYQTNFYNQTIFLPLNSN